VKQSDATSHSKLVWYYSKTHISNQNLPLGSYSKFHNSMHFLTDSRGLFLPSSRLMQNLEWTLLKHYGWNYGALPPPLLWFVVCCIAKLGYFVWKRATFVRFESSHATLCEFGATWRWLHEASVCKHVLLLLPGTAWLEARTSHAGLEHKCGLLNRRPKISTVTAANSYVFICYMYNFFHMIK